ENWSSANRLQSLDLNGSVPGAVEQSIHTTPGATYQLAFDYAANPDCGSATAKMRIDWGGSPVDQVSADSANHTPADLGWQSKSYAVTATAATTVVRFASLAPSGPCGPVLDNVAVTPTTATGAGSSSTPGSEPG